MDFDDVMKACTKFLEQYPSESIIMSIKEEYTPVHNTRSFEQTFDTYAHRYAGKWYLGATVPTLQQARGKVVLLRRFTAQQLPKGIDASGGWGRNTTFTINSREAHLRIQDQFVVPDDHAKWTCSTALLAEARERNPDALYINFTSGYRPAFFSIPNIRHVANTMGAYMKEYFSNHPRGRFGIIAMDFADAGKSSLIITTNYPPGDRAPVLTYALNRAK
jgi:1-phosphatidylinositol phosphodiesterase